LPPPGRRRCGARDPAPRGPAPPCWHHAGAGTRRTAGRAAADKRSQVHDGMRPVRGRSWSTSVSPSACRALAANCPCRRARPRGPGPGGRWCPPPRPEHRTRLPRQPAPCTAPRPAGSAGPRHDPGPTTVLATISRAARCRSTARRCTPGPPTSGPPQPAPRRERLHRREPPQEGGPRVLHPGDLRLLQHHLGDEDRVRIGCPAEGQPRPVVPRTSRAGAALNASRGLRHGLQDDGSGASAPGGVLSRAMLRKTIVRLGDTRHDRPPPRPRTARGGLGLLSSSCSARSSSPAPAGPPGRARPAWSHGGRWGAARRRFVLALRGLLDLRANLTAFRGRAMAPRS